MDTSGLVLTHGLPATVSPRGGSHRVSIESAVVVFMNFRYFVTVVLDDTSAGIAPLPPDSPDQEDT